MNEVSEAYKDGYLEAIVGTIGGLRAVAESRERDLDVITDPDDYRECEGEVDAYRDIIKLIKENL